MTDETRLPILIPLYGDERRDGVFPQKPHFITLPSGDDYMDEDPDVLVRVLPLDCSQFLADISGRAKFEQRFGAKVPEQKWLELVALFELMQALQPTAMTRRMKHARRFIETSVNAGLKEREGRGGEEIAAYKQRLLTGAQRNLQNAWTTLLIRLNSILREARLVMWWSDLEKRLQPGLYCPDAATGLAALVFSHVATTQGFGVCERCRKGFIRTRTDQRFCSLRCGNAHRQTQLRAKKGGGGRDEKKA